MALGGVAMGSMKAHDAPQAMMDASAMSGSCSVRATVMKMGMSSAAVAVLEVNSVRNTTKAVSDSMMMTGC